MKTFIKNSHCLILPSYHEGMANTLLEAGAMGRPLITSNISGCKEAVIDKETGYLVNVQDIEHLYDIILKFYLLTLEQKRNMGYKSYEYIKLNFDKKCVVNDTIRKLRGD